MSVLESLRRLSTSRVGTIDRPHRRLRTRGRDTSFFKNANRYEFARSPSVPPTRGHDLRFVFDSRLVSGTRFALWTVQTTHTVRVSIEHHRSSSPDTVSNSQNPTRILDETRRRTPGPAAARSNLKNGVDFRWGLRMVETVSGEDDGECSGEPRDRRESFELS